MPTYWQEYLGRQFYPEFTVGIMNEYVSEQAIILINDGYDVKALQSAICNTDKTNGLLQRFIQIVQESVN
jgi:hypothetical protein